MFATASDKSSHPFNYTDHKLFVVCRPPRKGYLKILGEKVHLVVNFGVLGIAFPAFIREKEINL